MANKLGMTVVAVLIWLFFLVIMPPTVTISWLPLALAIGSIWRSR